MTLTEANDTNEKMKSDILICSPVIKWDMYMHAIGARLEEIP